jgi:hypothetical protein
MEKCHFHLWMEKYFRSQEPFIADIDGKRLFCDAVHTVKLLDPLARLLIVLGKFLRQIRTDVRISFLKAITISID